MRLELCDQPPTLTVPYMSTPPRPPRLSDLPAREVVAYLVDAAWKSGPTSPTALVLARELVRRAEGAGAARRPACRKPNAVGRLSPSKPGGLP